MEKIKKTTMNEQYTEENLIRIEGKGETGEYIYNKYISAIVDDGFDLTIDKACHYLGCSYTYFITRLIDKIKHIRINTTARKLILLYEKINENLDHEVKPLINKRVLLNREDFFKYLRENTEVEQQYKVFEFEDFNTNRIEEIKRNIDLHNAKNKRQFTTLKSLFDDIIFGMISDNEAVTYKLPEVYILPKKFYSMRELKSRWLLKYDMDFYRLLEANGAKKYHLLGDFVRYDIREFEKSPNTISTSPNIIKMDYESYLELAEKCDDVTIKIENEALELSKKLANNF